MGMQSNTVPDTLRVLENMGGTPFCIQAHMQKWPFMCKSVSRRAPWCTWGEGCLRCEGEVGRLAQ